MIFILNRTITAFLIFLFLNSCSPNVSDTFSDNNQRANIPPIEAKTRSFEKKDGFFPVYKNHEDGRILLEIAENQLKKEFLYVISMATGGGMRSPRLDRAQIGEEQLARFERIGSRINLVLVHHRFVSTDPDQPQLARSVEESFPLSVVGSFDIMAEQEERMLIDVTSYFLDDLFDVRRLFRARNLGTFRVDKSRSYIYMPRTNAFPDNTEIEAAITLSSDNPSWSIRRHAPDGRSVTMRQHHSLVRLPDNNFRPRKYDPRAGYLEISHYDYSKGLDEDLITRYAVRHRLEKKDPDAELSDPVEPITYYLDPAIPEPYRTAFREGMEWFNGLFEAAGFRNAFKLEDMPPDMDPMDARYNVVMWVHRSEATASIGPSFRDPRTGEIIKAAVRMDSHRSLVNFNQYAGLIPAMHPSSVAPTESGYSPLEMPAKDDALYPYHRGYFQGCPLIDAPGTVEGAIGFDWMAALDPHIDAEEFAMARRRQHAAHELGHTLGLAHNFAAESMGRASVMDYPGADIRLKDGKLDLSGSFEPGPGAFDTLSIRWGYSVFSPEEEEEQLEAIIQEGIEKGLYHISAPYTRPFSSFPQVQAWTLAQDPISELYDAFELRHFLLEHFDERAIRKGEPMSLLRERFPPVYVMHRFLLSAVTKNIGGMEFRHALRGDGQQPTQIIAGETQREALQALLRALHPDELAVPERILELMPPSPWGYDHEPRAFTSPAYPAVDQLEFVRALSARIFSELLEPARTARLVAFASRDASLPTLEEVLTTVNSALFPSSGAFDWGDELRWSNEKQYTAIRRITQRMFTEALMNAASDNHTVAEARAAMEWMLENIAHHLEKISEKETGKTDPASMAQNRLLQKDIARFLEEGIFKPSIRPSPPMPNIFPMGQ